MIRLKECAGTKEQLDVVCEAGFLQTAAAPIPTRRAKKIRRRRVILRV